MAAQFIGLRVSLTLRSAPNAHIQGLVANVADQELTLHDVYFPASRTHLPRYCVLGAQIADLEVASAGPDLRQITSDAANQNDATTSVRPTNGHHSTSTHEAEHKRSPEVSPWERIQQNLKPEKSTLPQTQPLRDPAIISINRVPVRRTNGPSTSAHPGQEIERTSREDLTKPMSLLLSRLSVGGQHQNGSGGSDHVPLESSQNYTEAKDATISVPLKAPLRPSNVNSHLRGPDNSLDLASTADSRRISTPTLDPASNHASAALSTTQDTGQRSHRRDTRQNRRQGIQESTPVAGVRFRNTILAAKVGHLDSVTSKSKSRRHRACLAEEADGWATEEATDIQGMGEFDFQSNLSKFDKRTVFEQIRAEDVTAKETRLVSLNRRPARPGTAGGRNLHHTENVLDTPDTSGKWNSEAGETEEDEFFEGERSVRKSRSKQSIKKMPSRNGSLALGSAGQHISSSSSRVLSPLNHSQRNPGSTVSLKQEKDSYAGSPLTSNISSARPSLRLVPSGRSCLVVRSGQMLDVERIAEVELGLTEEMMTENAGRGIAELAVVALSPDSRRRMKDKNSVGLSLAIFIAGNNQSGLRTIAAARHLRNHDVQVVVCMVGLKRESLLQENVRRQLKLYQNCGGEAINWDGLSEKLAALDAAPALVIDGLLGTNDSYEDLRRDDQVAVSSLIRWVNNAKVDVLAVDIPSGVDSSTGMVSSRNGGSLYTHAQYVAAMGAPKAGILDAIVSGVGANWKVFVVDLGISNKAWRKYGTRWRGGVDFGSEWVVELAYDGGLE